MAFHNVGDEEGRVFESAHLEGGCFFAIGNTEKLGAGFEVSEADGIDEDKAVRKINHLNHSNNLRREGLGSLGPFGEEHPWPIQRPSIVQNGSAQCVGGRGRGRWVRSGSGSRRRGRSGFSRRGGLWWENLVLEGAAGQEQANQREEGKKNGELFHDGIIRILRRRSRRSWYECARRIRRRRSRGRSRR